MPSSVDTTDAAQRLATGARRIGLRALLVLLVVTAVATAIAPISYYFITKQQADARSAMDERSRAERQELRAKGLEKAQSVSRSSERAIATMDFLFLTEVIQTTVAGDQDVIYGIIMDRGGRALVHSDQSRANAVLASEADRFALAQTAPASQQLTVDGKPVLEAIAPIVVGGEPWGAVRFGLSLERLERDVARAQAAARADMQRGVASSIAAALLLGALAAFVGTFAAGRIVTPLQRLLDGVRSVREGDLEHRVEVAGSREIAELGGAYNEMTERLSSLLADMAAKASLERELGVARSVQQNMIPTADLHRVGGFVLVGHCEMAENCGGDWWGFHQLADGRLLVVIGDATGHGLPAAIIAATARGALQAAVTVNPAITPRAALEAIDRAIRDAGKEQILMTACAIALGADGRSVEFANAGHVLPLTCARDDAAAVNLGVLAARGAPLGSPTLHIGMRAATLPPGTVLVLMTDGLRERFNGARVMYGDRRLHRLLRQSPLGEDPRELCELRDHILDSVKGFAGDAVPDDDLTIVLCRGGDDHADDRPAPVVSEPDDLAARPTSSPGPA